MTNDNVAQGPSPEPPEAPQDPIRSLWARIRSIGNVSDVFIPQDVDYPALALDIDRVRASQLGLSEREVVSNVITALTSGQTETFPLYIYGAQLRGIPVQVNVIGTIIFASAVMLVVVSTLWQRRQSIRDFTPQRQVES